MTTASVVSGKRLLKNIADAQQAEEDQEDARALKEVERRKKYGTSAERDKAAEHLENTRQRLEEKAPGIREEIERLAFELQDLETNITTAAERVAAFETAKKQLAAVAPADILEARKRELNRVETEHARIHSLESRLDQIASILKLEASEEKMLYVRAHRLDGLILKSGEKASQWSINTDRWAEHLSALRSERAELEPELEQLRESRRQARAKADAELNAWIETE